MGDSITDFWGRRHGKFFPGKPYINRGVSVVFTTQMLLRFRADVMALKPRVVVIMGGTNDIGGSLGPVLQEATHDNIMSMVELARANGIRVVLASVTPVCDTPTVQTTKRPNAKLAELNMWLKAYAARQRIVYLDYWSAMLDDQGMLPRTQLRRPASQRCGLCRDGTAGREGDRRRPRPEVVSTTVRRP